MTTFFISNAILYSKFGFSCERSLKVRKCIRSVEEILRNITRS
ncbi:hypothetical protein DOY81_006377, partial [Sarcophaga bullata]